MKRWKSVDKKDKKKWSPSKYFYRCIIGVIDRVLLHCYNQGRKFTVETLKGEWSHLENMADNFATTDKISKNK